MNKVLSLIFIFIMVGCSANEQVSYYDTGEINSIGQIVDGEKNGEWINFKRNGDTLRIETYKNGFLDGAYYIYQENRISEIVQYHLDKKKKQTTYYPDGQIELEGAFKDEKQDGIWKYYYPSGNIWTIYEYSEGKVIGEFKEYYESGQIQVKGSVEGNFEDVKYYDSLGDLAWNIQYMDNKPYDTLVYNTVVIKNLIDK